MIVHTCEQGTPDWHALRLPLPTGSNASKLVYGSGKIAKDETMKAYAEKLAANKFAGEDIDAWSGNDFTERGHEVEPLARNWYSFEFGNDVEEVGFCTDDLIQYGVSPDGLIGNTGRWHGGSEFKCLPKAHPKALLYFNKHGKAQPDYLPQVHMNILVCDLEWMDLVYYHQKLPALRVRVERDEDFIKKLKNQLSLGIEHRDETIAVFEKMRG